MMCITYYKVEEGICEQMIKEYYYCTAKIRILYEVSKFENREL